MTKENIKNLVELQAEFQNACKNVCKHLIDLNDDYKYCYQFEIDGVDEQVECRGYYTVMNESQDVYAAFPVDFLTYTNGELDDYVSTELAKKELANKYGYKIIKI